MLASTEPALQVARLLEIDDAKKETGQGSEAALVDQQKASFDEAVDRRFFSWFRERYDLRSARRLMWRSLPILEQRWAKCCMALTLAAVCLFGLQTRLAPIHIAGLRLPDVQSSWPVWFLQGCLQGAALFIAAWLSPAFFNLILPRALFGSLVAWITLVLTSLPGLWAIEITPHVTLATVCHRYISTNRNAVLWSLPCLLFALVFVMREIGQWTDNRHIILARAVTTTVGLYFGSLFWGILFAAPIRHVLEIPFRLSCPCLVPIAVIGSSLAALFGIVVQLVWDEKSIAQPLEETL